MDSDRKARTVGDRLQDGVVLMKQSKIWGTTTKLFEHNDTSTHMIEVDAGGYCSKHLHEYRYNEFFVQHGMMEVIVWREDSGLKDITILSDGEKTIVPPCVYHQFRCMTPTVAMEFYWTEGGNPCEDNDIHRETCGGKG